jgi:hypothetical protein
MAQVGEGLPTKCKTLNSKLSWLKTRKGIYYGPIV